MYLVLAGLVEELEVRSSSAALHDHGQDALYTAAALNDVGAVELLLEKGDLHGFFSGVTNAYFSARDSRKHPAAAAAEFGGTQVLSLLISRGLDVNFRVSEHGMDLFSLALLGGQVDTINLLIENGYDLKCEYRFPNGNSYLDVARVSGSGELLKTIGDLCR